MGKNGLAGIDVLGPAFGFDKVGAKRVEDVLENQTTSLAIMALSPERLGDAIALAGDKLAITPFEANEESAYHLAGCAINDAPHGDVVHAGEPLEFIACRLRRRQWYVFGPEMHLGFKVPFIVIAGVTIWIDGPESYEAPSQNRNRSWHA
jgi:hypothetical protein